MDILIRWLKDALLEVQEYVRLCNATARGSSVGPFYYRDLVEQFDHIGMGSLTVVILTGMFTGAVLALQSGMTLDQFGARPFVGRLVSASMIKELGPVLTGADAHEPRRLQYCGGTGIDGRRRSGQRAACAGHRPHPQARRAARAGGHADEPGADRRVRLRRASSAAG